MSRVSVVVPTHNRADVLRDTLRRIVEQERPADEIIVVDDSSTDATPDVIASLGSVVRGIRIDRGKPAATRNAGAAAATGDWLLFTDDDCAVPADWVSRMTAAAESCGADALCGAIDAYGLDTAAERYQHYRMRLIFGDRAKNVSACPLVNFLVRREAFESVGGLDESLDFVLEDWAFGQRFTAAGYAIRYDPTIAVRHRYQTDWDAVMRRIRLTGADGITMADHLGRNRHAMAVSAVGKAALSPLWSLWRYPLDLYGRSLAVEWAFAKARLGAYFGAPRARS